MHEWALAESIITTALETAEKENLKKVTEITIHIGELQQIDHDIFTFALDEISKSQKKKKLKDVTFHLKIEKSSLKCNNCNQAWSYHDMKKKLTDDESEAIHFIPEVAFVYARCPRCGSPDFEISKGRGVSITAIKGER